MVHSGWNGSFRTMTPSYLPVTSTWSRGPQSDFTGLSCSITRSKENFTSSAVISP